MVSDNAAGKILRGALLLPVRSLSAVQDDALLDDIIARLLAGRNARPGKQVQLSEHEMRQLCLTARDIFMSQPNLLELEAPIKICGGHP